MEVSELKKLSTVSEISSPYTGHVFKMNFTDKRFVGRILKLLKDYKDIDNSIDDRLKSIDGIEDELDRAIAYNNMETEVLSDFKNSINDVFGNDFIDLYFDKDYLPDIYEYFPLFEDLSPYVNKAQESQSAVIEEIRKKYGIDRINLK